MKHEHIKTINRQRGSALMISLVILVAMTLIGVSAMRTTVYEEKMTNNMRDKELAFQAAEAALIDGENVIAELVTNAAFDGTSGKYGAADDLPDLLADASWDTDNSVAYSDTLDYVENQPRIILKYVGDIENNLGSLKSGGYGIRRTSSVSNFKVIARGTGSSANSAKVVLQSFYGKNM